MKKIFLVSVLILSGLVLSGCGSHHYSQYASNLDNKVEAPLKADIAVGEKISGEATSSILFGFFNLGGGDNKFAEGVNYGTTTGAGVLAGLDPFGTVKSAAAYNAISQSGADLIIAPRYVIDVQNYVVFKQIKATVVGYKGTLKGIK